MHRRFIAKKRRNCLGLLKVFLILLIIFTLLLKILSFKIFDTNTHLVSYIMESSNHLIITNLSYIDKLNDISSLITNIDIHSPDTLFQDNFIYVQDDKEKLQDSGDTLVPMLKSFMENINKVVPILEPTINSEENLPMVYIYNTHQTEEYVLGYENILNLEPNVYSAAYVLKELLEKKNIKTIVEDGNISEYLNNNNLNYDDSYIASRYYLQQAISKYPSVRIFIDLHRDALTHDVATVEHNGKNFAKVLFVVGLEHQNYKQNLDFANELNEIIVQNYNFLTRGVLTKSGPLVNGIYNQDLSNNIILLEVGGNESNFDEVCNTLELISDILYKRLGENNV